MLMMGSISIHTTMVLLFQLFCFLFALFSPTSNSQNLSSSSSSSSDPAILSQKESKPLPIETTFKLPSPLPNWPPGEGFASGTIDLGGLQLSQISSFQKIWTTHEGGPDNLGATFFDPFPVPEGFFMLGSYAQPNNVPLFGWVLVGKDLTGGGAGALKQPIDYTLVWSSNSSKIKQDGNGYVWLPNPPDGYKSMGHLVTNSSEKPSLDKIRCVRSDFTDSFEIGGLVWGHDEEEINAYNLRPTNRGIQALGIRAGTFIAQNGNANSSSIGCLKNSENHHLSSMPNLSQIQVLVRSYSPWIYFHPKEEYLPSSVSWFFENGALLYQKGNESNPVSIEPTGSNLPQGGSNDGAYWLNLPVDQAAKENVKKGNLQDAGVYLHAKPMLGGTFTDIAIWVFYPFNGASKAKFGVINVGLGKLGEHVGDWEHVTLRISNFNGELKSVYFSQHNGGLWVSASELEFERGNKPVTYSSLHSHAFQPKEGLVLLGNGGVGIKMEAAKSDARMDTGARFLEVAAEYLGPSSAVVEPPWLNYEREWGPKIDYDIAEETEKVGKVLPGLLKKKFKEFVGGIPHEVLGEEGPTGPKMKDNWSGDEKL